MDPISQKPLAELFREHRQDIDNLSVACRAAIAADPKTYGDDLFLLRFILSARGEFDKAVEALNETIAWRTKHADLLKALAAGQEPPHTAKFKQFNVGDRHKSLITGEPVLIVRIGLSNPVAMMDNMTDEEVYEFFIFNKEYFYAECDRLTREKGRIVKAVSLMDVRHVTMSNSGDKRFFAAMGRASKDTEKFYPQLGGLSVIFNMPFWMRAMVAVAKLFMSKQSMEKMRFCSGKPHKHPLGDCPHASSLIKPEDLPTFLGGTCSCPGGCIPGFSNDHDTIVAQDLTAAAKAEAAEKAAEMASASS